MARSAVAKCLGVAIAVPLCASLWPGDVQAADSKFYPGSICRQSPVDAGNISIDDAWVRNDSDSVVAIAHCPVMRDTAGGITDGHVKVYDRGPDNFNCFLIAETPINGTTVTQTFENKLSSGDHGNVQTLTFGAQGLQEYYYFVCTIPRVDNGHVSWIASVDLNET